MLGAIVLAGGPSSRFGRNKALIKLDERPIIAHVLSVCQMIVTRIIIVLGRDDSLDPYIDLPLKKVELVKDSAQNPNPLNGLATGFEHMDKKYSLVLPCDTPFVRSEILRFLAKEALGYDAAVPIWPNGNIEPLHAVYKVESVRQFLPKVLEDKNSRVSKLISELDAVKFVKTEEIRQFDSRLACFLNINNPQDLAKAKKMLMPITPLITA